MVVFFVLTLAVLVVDEWCVQWLCCRYGLGEAAAVFNGVCRCWWRIAELRLLSMLWVEGK